MIHSCCHVVRNHRHHCWWLSNLSPAVWTLNSNEYWGNQFTPITGIRKNKGCLVLCNLSPDDTWLVMSSSPLSSLLTSFTYNNRASSASISPWGATQSALCSLSYTASRLHNVSVLVCSLSSNCSICSHLGGRWLLLPFTSRCFVLYLHSSRVLSPSNDTVGRIFPHLNFSAHRMAPFKETAIC